MNLGVPFYFWATNMIEVKIMKFDYEKIMHEDEGKCWEEFGDDYLQPHAVYVNNKKLSRFMQKRYRVNDYKKFFREEYTDDDVRDMEEELRLLGAKFVPVGDPYEWL